MERRLISSCLLAAALVLGASACGDDSSSESVTLPTANEALSKVTPQHGQELIQQLGAELTVIDVRTAEEYASGHLEGAVNYDIEGGQFSALIEPLDRAKPYMVYCHSGRRSGIAADAMVAAGFTQVYDLGGIADWMAAGLPVVTG
ncbi:MAG: rhodanese-like domain-containing protein [Actinobacteria bacterium]|nr:rhodanese-like domain-containing protein [Actinomycetota bacterium]